MSNQLQVMSDLQAGQEDLSRRVEALEAVIREIVAAIGRELEVTRKDLIEGFTGKFAVVLLESTSAITRRVEENRQQLERAEQQTADLDERIRTFRAEIGGLLEEASGRLNGAFETHHARSESSLAAFSDKANAVSIAGMKMAEAARLCGNFKHDYEETATEARHSMEFTVDKLVDVLEQLRGVVESINQKAKALEALYIKWALFAGGAFVIGLFAGVLFSAILVAVR